MHPIEVLERYWNHTSFRPLQEDIIESVLDNEDTFVLLPTGGGKSVCFQIPALIKEGICIVVSPLIALMKDQVTQLKQKGIKAIALTSGLSYSELDRQLDNCIYGNYKFLYLSPERLRQQLVQERILRMDVNLIAVDEAHCISQWGNDFRPSYKHISVLRQLHPQVNCIALTATARPEVTADIIENLDFVQPKLFKASFARPNISYQVVHTNDKRYQLHYLLERYQGPSIVYVRNRRACIELSQFLQDKGMQTTFYHGGITNREKQDRLTAWTSERTPVMIATTAFGMGIDKANVKTVIHYNLPESLESYYQEAGRAGRDGQQAYAIIVKEEIDKDHLKAQFIHTLADVDYVKRVYNKLCNYFQISYGEGENTSYQFNFNDFCKTYSFRPGMCYNALQVLDRNAIISLLQHFSFRTQIQFICTNTAVFSYLEQNLHLNTLVKVLLRTYGGIFDYDTKVNLNLVIRKTELSESAVISQLRQLEKDGIISLDLANTDTEITFIKPREDDVTINPLARSIRQQNEQKAKQVDAVIAYINNETLCRSRQLLHYFGEDSEEDCGICSVCLDRNSQSKHTTVAIRSDVLEALRTEALTSRELQQRLSCSDRELLQCLTELLELKKIKLTNRNTYQIL
jgi:ATP-dependent DNA helicase RecQ